jgi:hypothetical protein
MNDRPPLNDREAQARQALTALAAAMLSKEVSFFEGADQVLRLRQEIGGIADHDPDFDAFVAIRSETDHLPLQAQQPLWNPEALTRLAPEWARTEIWAASFAPAACQRLLARFRGQP